MTFARNVGRRIDRLSLRVKLVAVITVPMIGLVALLLFLVAADHIRRGKQSAAAAATSLVRALAQDFERIERLDDQNVNVEIVDRLRPFEEVEQLSVFDQQGKVIFDYRRLGIRPSIPPTPTHAEIQFADGSLRMVQPLVNSARQFGWAYVQVSTADLDADAGRAIWMTVGAGLVTSLVGVALAVLLQRFISRPVLELQRAARAISTADDYSVRAAKFSSDEVGAVADAFNTMLERIEASSSALQRAHDELEQRVVERTIELTETNRRLGHEIDERVTAELELKIVQKRLIQTARKAGMAEVATSVLHNVGNVLNSVNVSASLISDRLRAFGTTDLAQVAQVVEQRRADLTSYLTQDERGRHLPDFLVQLSRHMDAESRTILAEVNHLTSNIAHIKQIVALQQSHAGITGVVEKVSLLDVIEDALRINSASIERHDIVVVQEYENDCRELFTDRQRLLQVLVNLISNAKYALIESEHHPKELTLRVQDLDADTVRIEVHDNGVGISSDNLPRLFTFGFTTRKEGHGFGLHSVALTAKEMGWQLSAHSNGPGSGARFRLDLPAKTTKEVAVALATLTP